MLTIVLADDHPMVRQGLRTVLEAEPDWRVVGEAADGLTVQPLAERLQPDIAIVDLMLPGLGGLAVAAQIRAIAPHTRTLVFSMHADNAYVREAFKHGAVGYVLKDADATEIVHAVRVVSEGRRYLSRALAERAIDSYLQQADDTTLDWVEMLTAREREVLQLAAQGATNAEIGARLTISPRTAETHRANLMRKLGLHTQADLLRYAVQHGLLTGGTRPER